MPEPRFKSFNAPDDTIEFPLLTAKLVEVGDFTVGYIVHQPGWRWSTHVRPTVGGDWCQARHVGVVLSGRAMVMFEDGTTYELGPEDVIDVPPGHDGWVIGDEPFVQLEWTGLHTFIGLHGGRGGALATLLFTDLVESTATAARLGDRAWRELLSAHFEASRSAIDRFRGREIDTTGDGIFATFDGPARALRCAAAIRMAAGRQGLRIRAGVHVGEVELVGQNVRGVTVHEAARIMAAAGDGEILVSEITRTLAQASGFSFEDRGTHALKGLDGDWRLYAYVEDGEPAA